MVLRAIFVPDRRGQSHQIGKLRFILCIQNARFWADAKCNFLAALKSSGIMRKASLGKFQSMPSE